MLIFFTQTITPDDKEQARFERIKKKMGKLYSIEQKRQAKLGQKLIMKSGQSWFAVHQFI